MLLRGGAAAGRSREAVEQRRQQRQPQGASGSPTLEALESDRNPALPTHDRVNDALVVLFDRGRQRMIFVVGVASSAVRTSVPQVEELVRIARARQVYMHDVDGDVLHVYGKRLAGKVLVRSFRSAGAEQVNPTAAAARAQRGRDPADHHASRRRDPDMPLRAWLKGRSPDVRRKRGGRLPFKYEGFIRQVQGLRLEFPIAPGISIIRNSDLLHMQDDDGDDGDEPYSGGAGSSDDGNAGGDSDGSSRGSSSSSTGSASRGFGDALGGLLTPPEGEAPGWGAEDGGGYNCQISLGSGPSDWTLRIRVQPDPPGSGGEGAAAPSGRSIVEHLERCLKGDIARGRGEDGDPASSLEADWAAAELAARRRTKDDHGSSGGSSSARATEQHQDESQEGEPSLHHPASSSSTSSDGPSGDARGGQKADVLRRVQSMLRGGRYNMLGGAAAGGATEPPAPEMPAGSGSGSSLPQSSRHGGHDMEPSGGCTTSGAASGQGPEAALPPSSDGMPTASSSAGGPIHSEGARGPVSPAPASSASDELSRHAASKSPFRALGSSRRSSMPASAAGGGSSSSSSSNSGGSGGARVDKDSASAAAGEEGGGAGGEDAVAEELVANRRLMELLLGRPPTQRDMDQFRRAVEGAAELERRMQQLRQQAVTAGSSKEVQKVDAETREAVRAYMASGGEWLAEQMMSASTSGEGSRRGSSRSRGRGGSGEDGSRFRSRRLMIPDDVEGLRKSRASTSGRAVRARRGLQGGQRPRPARAAGAGSTTPSPLGVDGSGSVGQQEGSTSALVPSTRARMAAASRSARGRAGGAALAGPSPVAAAAPDPRVSELVRQLRPAGRHAGVFRQDAVLLVEPRVLGPLTELWHELECGSMLPDVARRCRAPDAPRRAA